MLIFTQKLRRIFGALMSSTYYCFIAISLLHLSTGDYFEYKWAKALALSCIFWVLMTLLDFVVIILKNRQQAKANERN